MPDPNLQAAIKEAFALAPSDVVVLDTIEINHPSLSAPYYLVANNVDITATLEDGETVVTFCRSNFQISLPGKNNQGLQELQLAIDNVDRRISAFIAGVLAYATFTKVTVTWRPYLANDLSKPQTIPPLVLTLTDLQMDAYTVSARASFNDLVNLQFPSQNYTRARFPSLGG